ncbi:RND efflux membrane fusion protein precursor [Xenorhabdus mauleonii]|uniref:Membrane fusion protein, multidrug efflux system n=1 Tax=Xenorhabdus mauleonii TaxID=351675 RepID=A0A1I3WA86_9GAMM|nr:efflux RND transporter periplasmic adaptor subunit [Xenorhabdus mauleonii]PHM36745.1 RND efflux membrane fusion protein precursor [Xenorhabdus mauleonii]SFK04103.1 membrane fusion protein, multidrug efflux system [Xenorhabdus mauleonii]
MRKKILIGLGTALLVAVIGLSIYNVNGSTPDKPEHSAYPPVKVALADVEEAHIPRILHGVGELEAAKQVHVASETGGIIKRIAFESGQHVEAGQLLVQLNDAVEQAELNRLQAQWKNADRLYHRTNKLFASKVISAAQLDNVQAERDMAQASIRQVQAQIAQKTIRAPFSGTIGIRQIHDGQYLRAGDPIVSLVDAKHLKLNFSLDEQESPELHIGQDVNVSVDAYPKQIFTAKISAIDPLVGKSRMVSVQALLNNSDNQLKAGMFANIQVKRADNAPVLTIPETAVTYTAYGDTVFVAQAVPDSKSMIAKRVSVEVGQRWQGMVEIKTGVSQGDLVVTSGQLKLNDGTPVEAIADDTLKVTKASTVEAK